MKHTAFLIKALHNRGEKKKFSSGFILSRVIKKDNPNRSEYLTASSPITVTIPKSVAKSAVKRNFLRRRIESALKPLEKELYNKNIFAQVFFWRQPDINTIYHEISTLLGA
jgi:ribonuclease P protein component